jgi:SWI/SNF-related matrix-associated actin-dependent regulator of chromatin subfamily A member 5
VSQAKKVEMIKSLHMVLKPFMLRRVKADLTFKLPEKIEINVMLEMTPIQQNLYKTLVLNAGMMIAKQDAEGNNKILKKRHSNLLMHLRKACMHPYLFPDIEDPDADEYGEHLVENSAKLQFLDLLLAKTAKAKEQVLIFS